MAERRTMHPDFSVPDNIELRSVEQVFTGEHNQCFRCGGSIDGNPGSFFLKVYHKPEINLPIERDILPRLAGFGIPVPKVLFEQDGEVSCLGLTSITGDILQDFIDPRRPGYRSAEVLEHLEKYGEILARIHSLPMETTPLTRRGLYALSVAERSHFSDQPDLLGWLDRNAPTEADEVFAHGDLHTAHVFFEHGEVSGVIDWESAGMGWREFDLAWILRSRQAFLNSPEEREAILKGYSRHGTWDNAALNWCEVLVYLHYAFWMRESDCGYEAFALERAGAICAIPRT